MTKKKRTGHKAKPPGKDFKKKLFNSLKGINSGKKEPHLLDKPTKRRELGSGQDKKEPVIDNPASELMPEPRGRGDSGALLTDPHHLRGDLKLVEQAISKGYNIRRKSMLRDRLYDIAMKTSGEVNTKEGLVDSETKGDELAIQSIRCLVEMDKADIKRIEMTNKAPPATTNINILNQQTNNATVIDARQAQLIELAKSFGASKLDINGRTVNTGQEGEATNSPEDIQ